MAESPHLKVKQYTFALDTPGGTLPAISVEIPDAPMAMHELVPLTQALCNGIVDKACDALPSERWITCSKGCGSCCNQVVPISVPEVEFLTDYINQLPVARSDSLKERFRSAYEHFTDLGILQGLLDGNLSDEKMVKYTERYFREGIPCPFLEDGACSIHDVRPFACREFNAISDPENCEDPFTRKVERVSVVPKMTSVMARLAMRVTGAPARLLPLVTLFSENGQDAGWTKKTNGITLFDLLLECFAPPS